MLSEDFMSCLIWYKQQMKMICDLTWFYLSKLKGNYHTQGTQWVENNSGLMVSLLSTVIQILKKENILSRPEHSEFYCIVLHYFLVNLYKKQ